MALKKAYLILAHSNVSQLIRLLTRLDDGNTWFFIHIDKKVPIREFDPLVGLKKENIILVDREDGKWGSLGLVRATLNGLKSICEHPENFDYIHLLSGQDYPLVSNKAIDSFFSANYGKNFIEYFSMPVQIKKYGDMKRIEWYHFVKMKYYTPWKWYPLMIANKFLTVIPFFKRKFPSYLKPYVGSQWWSITLPAAKYILEFIKQHPDYLHFHRHTLIPDEIFFQTILLNTTDTSLKESIVNDNLRYIVWSRPGVKDFPLLFRINDYQELIDSGKLWSRKFDPNTDSLILDSLDKYALEH